MHESYGEFEEIITYTFSKTDSVSLEEGSFPKGSLQASLDVELKRKGMKPIYEWSEKFGEPLLIEIGDLKGDFIVFVNDKEPGEGTIPLREVFPDEGDEIKVIRLIV